MRRGVGNEPTSSAPILITGATGFIAANFVYQFAQHGHHVIAYDVNLPIPILTEYWAPYAENITFEQGSVTDAGAAESRWARSTDPTALCMRPRSPR